jgi:deazaflavin-dependent oxidoreductase (nitroreductase family)
MSISAERAARPNPGVVAPVPPSPAVRIVLRPLARRLNPLILKLAGRPRFRMAALLRHTGRRSGRSYATPVSARRSGDVVLIALTFGNTSDWARNVRAAGGCSIRLAGADLDLRAPALLDRAEAAPYLRAAFSPLERFSLRLLGIQQFMRLDVVPAA